MGPRRVEALVVQALSRLSRDSWPGRPEAAGQAGLKYRLIADGHLGLKCRLSADDHLELNKLLISDGHLG